MVENTPGCLEQLVTTLVLILSLFFGAVRPAPVPTPSAARPTIEIKLELPANATQEQITSAHTIIQARLNQLNKAGLIPAGFNAQAGKQFITVQFAEGTLRSPEIARSLANPGLLELVDMSELSIDQIEQLKKQPIRTTAAPERKGADPQSRVFATVITNIDVESATAQKSSYNDTWLVQITFKKEAGERFGEFTGSHINKPVAIVIDGMIISAPIVQARISTSVQIAGNYSANEARILAVQFSSTPLPFPLTVASIDVIK